MKKVSFYLMALFCIMLGFTACSNNNEPDDDSKKEEEGNLKRVAAAFYFGENLFPEMEYFSLRFTTGTLDLSQNPAVGTGDAVVLEFFSECQDGVIFPKEGEYEIIDMDKVENGYAMAGANYMGKNLGCYVMFAEDGQVKTDENGNTGDYITKGTITIEGTPKEAIITANVYLEILQEERTYKYVGPLTIKDASK